MLSIDAASAASTHPVTDVERTVLYTGPIVKMKVPVGASGGAYPSSEGLIPYLQFCHTIPGGRVNFFVHTADKMVRGRTITAGASVLKKTLPDGREYLYVDLKPVEADTPITHRLAVMNNLDASWDNSDPLIFATPLPLKGVIIFASPDAKMIPTGTGVRKLSAN